ncbi:MAG: fumarylacetoacetate hydrolase family protein [Chloroflexi bacterium]|nr:fumarylacetoacetate hydrolase family protein [Chloroflexota bacterium]
MKLVLFDDFRLGVLKDGGVVDVMNAVKDVPAHTPQTLMAGVIEAFPRLRPRLEEAAAKGAVKPLGRVRLRAPLPRPGKLVCAAVNYMEFGTRQPEELPLEAFLKASNAVIGDGDTVVLDEECKATVFHHEAELALVIGKVAKKVPQSKAMDYIFGYTGLMDISARGFNPGGRVSFFQVKSWDTFAPMGPCIVTADEIPDPSNLNLRMWCSGEPRHNFNTSDMAHKIPELVEFLSRVITLEPGDVVATGTNHQGIGAIQDGDEVVMEVQGVGKLTVHVKDPAKRQWPRGVDEAMASRMRGPAAPRR